MSNPFSAPQVAPAINPNQTYTPVGFNAGDITANFNKGTGFTLGTGQQRSDLLSGYNSDIGGSIGALGGLNELTANNYNTVAPGFNQLLQTQLSDLGDQSRAAMGNLQQNLSARRIMGSSFGNDTMSRLNAEFAKQRDATIADTFMKSLTAQQSLIQQATNTAIQQAALRQTQYQAGVDSLNLPANIATQLTGGVNSQLASNAQTFAQAQNSVNIAQAQAQQATNTGIGSLFGAGLGAIGNIFG